MTEGQQAKTEDQLVRAHLALVNYMVAEIAGRIPRHVCRDDLISAGMAGLAQAARSYDPERGITFQRFASARIRGALLDELRSRDWASRSVRAKARDVQQVTDHLTARLGRNLNYRGDMIDAELSLWAASHNLLKAIKAATARQARQARAAAAPTAA